MWIWQTHIKSYNIEYLRNKIVIVKMRIDYNRLIYIINPEQIGNTSKPTHQTISFFCFCFCWETERIWQSNWENDYPVGKISV